MAESYRARIPFESLDPLTIGAADDESKIYRDELELEIPERNLLAAIYPEEPEPGASATEAARAAKTTIGQARAAYWGAGGGGKRDRPGAGPEGTLESTHCAFVRSPPTHYGACAGPMRSDSAEVATMCGRDCTMNVLLDTRGR